MAKTCTLKDIPPEVFQIVQKEQAEIKARKKTNQFSFEATIYKMIRDYDKCRKDVKFKPEES